MKYCHLIPQNPAFLKAENPQCRIPRDEVTVCSVFCLKMFHSRAVLLQNHYPVICGRKRIDQSLSSLPFLMKIKDAAREENGVFSMVERVSQISCPKVGNYAKRRGISDDDYMVMIETEREKVLKRKGNHLILAPFPLLIACALPARAPRSPT